MFVLPMFLMVVFVTAVGVKLHQLRQLDFLTAEVESDRIDDEGVLELLGHLAEVFIEQVAT